MNAHDTVDWVFDPVPPSGARTGGDPAMYAFRPELEVFVREVLQNSNDASISADLVNSEREPVQVTFILRRLSQDRVAVFKKAIRWQSLLPHLQAVAEQQDGATVLQALQRLEEGSGELLLLSINDRRTIGLQGPERGAEVRPGERSNFTALCKDTLFSDKQSSSAGGSYGLGKAVLWSFSEFRTVLFCSRLHKDVPAGKENPRFIGRTLLPWHRVGNGAEFIGCGWLGWKENAGAGDAAVSVWGEPAVSLSQGLFCAVSDEEVPGTTITVVGFREPTSEERRNPEEIADAIISAASEAFWPCLGGKHPRLDIRVEYYDDDHLVIQSSVEVQPKEQVLAETYSRYLAGDVSSSLRAPGDIVVVPIPIRIPAKKDNSAAARDTEASLVVRMLKPEDQQNPYAGKVLYFRGAGMVITSQDVSIPAAANPFTALLVCGQARAAGETDDGSDEEQERFLKAAEPARHNKWTRTEKLGEVYKPGYMDALKKIQKLVRDKILDLVACERAGGREGPQLLRAKFPLGLDGGGGREQPISLSRPCAEVAEGGAWRFSGSVRRNRPAGGNWKVRVKLRFAQDGGGRNNDDTGLIKALTTTAGTVRLSPEGAEVTVPPDTDSFDFSGESDVERHPVSSRDSVISVEVSGQVGADGQED